MAERRSPPASLLALLLLAGLPVGCAEPEPEPPPRWIELARGLEPEPLLPLARAWQREAGLDPALCAEGYLGVEVSHPLPPEAWAQRDGLWEAALPAGATAHGSAGFARLELGEVELPEHVGDAPPSGSFRVVDGVVRADMPAGGPPAGIVLVQRLEVGRAASDGNWQVRSGDAHGNGFPVWSGHHQELQLDLPARSALTLELRWRGREARGEAGLRILVDGEPVDEVRAEAAVLARRGLLARIALPASARDGARLRLEAFGPPGAALVMRPVVGPLEIGAPGTRPWSGPQPDLVVVIADTLRADVLATYGGHPSIAPRLNALAKRSARYLEARSNAAWTLPSISTLLTGLAPGQHTANETTLSLPGGLTTVVESLARAGYRTAAVTDACFFSPQWGLDQGFETFVQRQPKDWDLDATVARARELVGGDDGRPLFLVVHTYRAHLPFRVGPDEDRSRWDALRAQGCTPLKSMAGPRDEWLAELARCGGDFRDLYHEGVRDLDRGLGVLLDTLGEYGLLEHGYLLFTSDHGEALGENDEMFHAGKLWESKLRIPLLLAGPDVTPRDVAAPVTLLDVAPTLADLAGLGRQPEWSGHSLLAPPADRPSLAFRLQSVTQVTVLDGHGKLSTETPGTLAEGAYDAAWDLERTPFESREAADASSWAPDVARRHAALVEALLVPATASADVPLGPAQLEQLKALGYGGEGEGR